MASAQISVHSGRSRARAEQGPPTPDASLPLPEAALKRLGTGLSGAAVFSGPHLVGMVIAVPQGYQRSLVARRIEPIADDASLHEARGAAVALEAVAGGELGAGLRDLRVRLPDRVRTFTGRTSRSWPGSARPAPR